MPKTRSADQVEPVTEMKNSDLKKRFKAVVQQLVDNELITQQEANEMLTGAGHDGVPNCDHNSRRSSHTEGEQRGNNPENTTMSVKNIILAIERSRHVMDAQLEALEKTSPKAVTVTLSGADVQADAGKLLRAAVQAHLEAAAGSLREVADVESMLRAGPGATVKPGDAEPRKPEIIDVVPTVVMPTEDA